MIASVVALAFWPSLFGPPAPPAVQKYRVAGWTAERRFNRFTGEVRCRLRRGSVTYEGGLMTLRLGRRVNTANAVFRVDGGQPRLAADVRFEAVSLGADIHHDRLPNPSRGEVHIPARLLAAAGAVAVRPRADAGDVRTFRIAGLEAAIAAAAARGCRDQAPDYGRTVVVTRPAELVLPPAGSAREDGRQ